MTERRFNKPQAGLQRDEAGHRTGFKVLIRQRVPMSNEAFKRWGIRQRQYISKSRYVYRYYSSSASIGMKNGIPIEYMKNNKMLGRYLIDVFLLGNGETFSVHGWTAGKTATKVKLTKTLFIIKVHDADKYNFEISKDGRMSRYWFRASKKKERHHEMS